MNAMTLFHQIFGFDAIGKEVTDNVGLQFDQRCSQDRGEKR
jgi:hypothetical protein